MREILFKAKGTTTGKWYEGFLVALNEDCCHIKDDKGAVYYCDINTICQYTGLTDKNGNKIWENDIIRTQKFTDKPHSRNFKEKDFVGVVTYKIYSTNNFNNPSIPNHNYEAKWEVKLTENVGKFSYCSKSKFYDCEVIGNRFDNTELLEV